MSITNVMDPKLFQQRLAELADIQIIKEAGSSGERANDPQQVHRQGQLVEINPKSNSTWSVRAKRIKPITRQCEDCLHQVTDRLVTHSLYNYPETHWRTTCQSCQMVKHPITGRFELSTRRAQSAFLTYFKKENK